MKPLTRRDKHTIRFLQWIRKHPGWRPLICTPVRGHMNLDMMKMLIEQLAEMDNLIAVTFEKLVPACSQMSNVSSLAGGIWRNRRP